ncbi:RHS repeat-associated protein [Chryseobacterium rhizosphaerae]|uniref:RHS repeat-associated core domain-containing protein n=1 Tax=Chryseobacterium rhizosphaerae TaxID=395937 RepID=UPI002861DEA5|nr:RHS repeat-associated core domain-containing protein [Chryseobacterium rhizosphaerae]MDR6544287.1 RHS repeat-associated protein [Chryseobacterium rhizosphaerae]
MKFILSFILSLCSVLGFSQTILYQGESTSRTVQDPQTVVLAQGFHAKSDVSNPFIAKIGPNTENQGGGPVDSGAGATNPSGTTAPDGKNFHDTKGNIEVNGAGQLQFTLPIALPPGVKSVAPQVNLVYTSGAGNGIAGYSWNLSGITAISRIGKTIEKDGEVKGIQLDYSDYYSFNGQRLILKSGEYGKDGAEYVTEKYSNIKIKSVGAISGQAWQGPEYWEMTFEDGSQAWYGSAALGNSQARTPIEYNIVKWKDAQSNYITYNYSQIVSTNVAIISSIEWGGNEALGKTHFNKIEFTYIDRNIKEQSYVLGVVYTQGKLLSEIKVSSNGSQFKKYAVEYISNGTSYQFANKITEYNASNQAANPVTIEYEPYQAGNEETTKENNIATNNTKKYGDFDMDGITDYLEFIPNPGSSPSGPVGVIHFINSVYKDSPVIPMQYELSRFTAEEFAKATAVTFKKDGYVKNKVGIVIPHKVATSDPQKPNYELLIYSADISDFKFKLEYSKVIPFALYNPGGELGDDTACTASSPLNVNYLESYDYDGDGISELMIGFSKRNRCTSAPYPNISNPGYSDTTELIDSQLPLLQPRINSSNVEYGDDVLASLELENSQNRIIPPDGSTIDYFTYYSSYLIDIDENTDVSNSIYRYDGGVNINNSLDNNRNNRFADLNGDGIQDIIQIKPDGTITNVYNLRKQTAGSYVKVSIGSFPGQKLEGISSAALYGDFNGDSKVDILVPQANKSYNWNLYISDGKKFNQSFINNFIYYSSGGEVLMENSHHILEAGGGCSFSDSRYFQYNVADLDADGKSDIVVSYIFISNHEWNSHHDQEKTVLRTFVYSVNKTTTDNTANFAKAFYSSAGGDSAFLQNSPIQTNGDLNFYRVRDWRREYAQKVIPFGTLSLNRTNQQIISIGKPDDCSGVIGCPYNYVTQYGYPYIPSLARTKFIKQGDVTTEVSYQELNSKADENFYKPIKKELFPYFELEQIPLSAAVSRLKQNTPDKTLIQDLRYRGFLSHLTGKGMIGFRQSTRSSWYADGFENTKIWSGVEIDPLFDGVPVKEWSIRTNDESKIFPADISENNTQLLSFKSTIYEAFKLLNEQLVTAPVSETDKPKIVIATVPKNTKAKDFLSGTTTSGSITYGDYYLPKQSITNINNGYAVTTSDFEYIHNLSGSGADYYIGRPKAKTETIQAYGDTKSGKEEYTYENNLLKALKTWNRDNTGYLLETYSYDSFGNIIQKVTNNSVDSQTQTTKAEFDPKGRFVLKKTDNLGLETNIEYNDWGQIKNQADALGNTLVNTYDSWGKLLTSKTNLGGTTTYQYNRDDSSNITMTQYDPDGDITRKYTNKLGQEYKVSTKAFGQGKFVSQETQYDLLGRKLKESEPYFEGQSANQWNTIAYDDNFFPAKVTTTSFNGKQMETTISGNTTTVKEISPADYGRTNSKTTDALGNVVSTTDKGGTIQFSYNAAGEQTQAKYAENVVTTKYDSWGRKSEFNDPSNGIYKYEYDGFGQPKKIISPKGTKEYTYNNLGQLISQKEVSTTDSGQATNKTISFTYDNKGRVVAKSGTSKGQAYSNNASYDPQGRLLSSSENSNGKYFIQKGITYDDKARIISYEKQLYSSGTLTKVQIENVYSAWSGQLYQVKDKTSGKILWELKETNAKDQVVKAKLGVADINNTYDASGFLTGVNHSSTIKPSILQLSYSFDAIKNELKSRTTGGDFNIVESFDYDGNNRLINWTNPVTGVKVQNATRNVYDAKGRILENDQVGKIKFDNSSKIYQPTGMILNAEGTQNYNNDLIQSIVYNENNDPVFIDGGKGDVAFQYGLTSMRQRVTYGGNFSTDGEGKFTKYYSEDGSYEIVKDNTTGKEKHILYIGGTPYESNIVFLKDFTESSGSYKFLHKDYIGSILAISDEAGNKLEQRHFDAWGNFTHLQMGSGAIITDKNIIDNTSLLVDRGYTSHEHFAEVGIIHMNGRLYDPLLRRFLNADENIQDSYNTQNYNKYGYVLNNPLMFNDPSGEFILESAFLSAVIIGAMIASFSYTVMVSITGQDWNLGSFLKSTLFGAASAAVTYGIGSLFITSTGTATQIATELGKLGTIFVQGTAHALAQGVLSLVQGEGFGSAFASGFLGSIGASAFGAVAGKFANSAVGTITSGAVLGGLGSELTGGNFWQGALIGGFVAGFNHVMHEIGNEFTQKEPQQKKESWDLDGDGKMDLGEANNWYRKGKGQAVTLDASKIDLDFVDTKGWVKGKTYNVQTLTRSSDGRVLGNITVKYLGNNQVSILSDTYNFEQHGKFMDSPFRNAATVVGKWYAGQGGVDFQINFKGINTIMLRVYNFERGPKY